MVRLAQVCEDAKNHWMVHFKRMDFMGCDYISSLKRCFQNFPKLAPSAHIHPLPQFSSVILEVPAGKFWPALSIADFFGCSCSSCSSPSLGLAPSSTCSWPLGILPQNWLFPWPILTWVGWFLVIDLWELFAYARPMSFVELCTASIFSQPVLWLWTLLMVHLDKPTCLR